MHKGLYLLLAILAVLIGYIMPQLLAAIAALLFYPWINGDLKKTQT